MVLFSFVRQRLTSPSVSSLFAVPLLCPSRRLFFYAISRLIYHLMNLSFFLCLNVSTAHATDVGYFHFLPSFPPTVTWFAFLNSIPIRIFSWRQPTIEVCLKVMCCMMANILQIPSNINYYSYLWALYTHSRRTRVNPNLSHICFAYKGSRLFSEHLMFALHGGSSSPSYSLVTNTANIFNGQTRYNWVQLWSQRAKKVLGGRAKSLAD